MELERIIPETGRRVNAEKIAEYCRRLADVLVNKTWHLDDVLGAHVQREIRRVVVLTEPIGSTDLMSARTIKVTADFWADKEEDDFDEESLVTEYSPHYKIRAALSEEVGSSELPEWVLGKLKDQPVFQKKNEANSDSGVFFQDEDMEPELDVEMLDVFSYEKTTAMHYVLGDDGWIEDFGIECRYECNGQIIDSREYSWSDGVIEDISSLYIGAEDDEDSETGEVSATPRLTEEEIQRFGAQFDQVMQQILDEDRKTQFNEAFARFEEVEVRASREADAKTHYSRAFGMLALNAARFIGMRIK